VHCYGPPQFAKAYNLAALHNNGIDGRGTTIVIVDAFGSPTIQADLHQFDQDYGLPDPPSLKILQPVGSPPVERHARYQPERCRGWLRSRVYLVCAGAGRVLPHRWH
jgi:hypothetical protein